MHLVDEQDGILGLHDLGDDLLHALLKLAAVLGSGDERGDVERPDLTIAQDVWHVAARDELRQAFHHGRLSHTGIAQDERVVLLAARHYLHDALHLAVAADHGIESALGGELGEVAAKALEQRAVVLPALLHAGEGHLVGAAHVATPAV